MSLAQSFVQVFSRLRQVLLPKAGGSSADRLESFLPSLYLLIALPMVFFFSLRVPPLWLVPDEANHLKRIEQLTRLQWIGVRLDARNSGGAVDGAIVQLETVLEPHEKPSSLALKQAGALPWAGHDEIASFPNTVQYGPFGYVPQALSLAAARAVGLGPLHSIRCARLFTGLCSLALGFAALGLARRGRIVLFSLLTMPMAFFLAGSLSQDAVLLPVASLMLAWISGSQERERRLGLGFWGLASLLLVMLGTARPPWLVLGIPLLFAGMDAPSRKTFLRAAVVLGLAAIVVLGWLALVRSLQVEWRPGTSGAAQLRFLLSHPGQIPTILLSSFRGPSWHYLVGDVVGVFGVADPSLSHAVQGIAFLGLGGAVLLESARTGLNAWSRAAFAFAFLCGFALLYLAMYLTWTPVGRLSIEGMQGRYVVPLYAAAALALQGSVRPGSWRLPVLVLVALVPLVGCGASVLKILQLCPP